MEEVTGLVCGKCGAAYPPYEKASVHADNMTRAAMWMLGYATNTGYLHVSTYQASAERGTYCEKCNAVVLRRCENYMKAYHQLGNGDLRSTWKD